MSQSPNKLLAALPPRDYDRVRPLLRTLHLLDEALLPHCRYTRVYFPGTTLCSMITRMADESVIEVACIGNEGIVGLPSLSGQFSDERSSFVQVADGALQYMPVVLFERELAHSDTLRELVDGYCHSFLETSIQAIACNRLHSTEQRCCRWLLSAHDRLDRVRFELKVRFLARAMGVKNSEIATIFAALENHGLIRHDGESITIIDAVGLRAIACRCYEAMKRGYTRAVPAASHPQVPAFQENVSARIIPMRGAAGACTLCGSSVRLPHRNGHACILALDEEIGVLVHRTHTLRRFRTQLVTQRAQLFRDVLTRTAGGLVKRTLP